MKYLKTLVLMQLKDKIDLSFVKSTKTLIQKIVFTLLKFLVVGAIAYVLCLLLTTMLIDRSDVDKLMVVIATFLILTSIITCTVGLVKSLYFAADNKVLITLPVKNNVIFISKLIVSYFYETVKMYSLLVPLLLGCMLPTPGISSSASPSRCARQPAATISASGFLRWARLIIWRDFLSLVPVTVQVAMR